MKKKAVLITIISIFIIAAGIFLVKQNSGASYLRIIKSNWDISLPSNCREVYEIDSGASFHGDGLRYHVFKYTAGITFDNAIQEQKISKDDIERISNILRSLGAEDEFYPDFDNITLAVKQKENDSSTLYLCCSKAQNMLYVIEDIY